MSYVAERTVVATPSGYQRIETLSEGDLIKNSQGENVKILEVIKEVYRAPVSREYRPIVLDAGCVAPMVPFMDTYITRFQKFELRNGMISPNAIARYVIQTNDYKADMFMRKMHDCCNDTIYRMYDMVWYTLVLEEGEDFIANGLSCASQKKEK